MGRVVGRLNAWCSQPSFSETKSSFQKFMNRKGAQVIDALNETLIASNFFPSERDLVSEANPVIAAHFSTFGDTVVFCVSPCGALIEFRGGKQHMVHREADQHFQDVFRTDFTCFPFDPVRHEVMQLQKKLFTPPDI